MCSKILLLRLPYTSATACLSPQLGSEKISQHSTFHSEKISQHSTFRCSPAITSAWPQLPTDENIRQIRGICCSQGGMGRKKGELSQKNKSKVALPSICQESSGIQAAGSPLQLDKTGSSTLISIAAKPGAKHSSITHLSEVRALTFYRVFLISSSHP